MRTWRPLAIFLVAFAALLPGTASARQSSTIDPEVQLTDEEPDENEPAGTVAATLSSEGLGQPTYALVSGPGDDDNGLFSVDNDADVLRTTGPLDYEAQSSYSVRVRATHDPSGRSEEDSFTITIKDVDEPPVLAVPADQANQEGDAVSLQVTASDPEGEDLEYEADGLPDGLDIDEDTGAITGTIEEGATEDSPYTVTITVSDDDFEDTGTFEWTVTAVTAASPTVSLSGGSVAENEPIGTPVGTLSSTDLAAPVVYTFVSGDGDDDNGAFGIDGDVLETGTALDFEQQQSYTVRVRATGAGGLEVEESFAITVTDVDEAPALTVPADQANQEGDVVSLTVTATDPEGGALTFSASGLPDGLGIDGLTGEISGTIAAGAAASSPYTVEVTVEDPAGNATTGTFTWTVAPPANQPPVLTVPADQANQEGDVVSLTVTATDPEGGALTFSASGLPDGLGIDGLTGEISGTIAAGAAASSPYTVEVTVEDPAGLSDSASFQWTVTAAPAPTVSLSGGTVAEDAAIGTAAGTLTSTGLAPPVDYAFASGEGDDDNGSFRIDRGALETDELLDFEQQQSYSVRIRATGAGGLWAEDSFTITVTDVDEAPVFNSVPAEQTNREGQTVTGVSVEAADPEGAAITYSATGLPPGLSIDSSTGEIAGTIGAGAAASSPFAVTVTASDFIPGGNETSASFQWFVTSPLNPTVSLSSTTVAENVPVRTTVGTFTAVDLNPPATYALVAGDGDDDNAAFAISSDVLQTRVPLDFETQASYSIRVRATGAPGSGAPLSTERSFTITVTDVDEAPVLTAVPGNQANQEGDTITPLTVTATDPEGAAITYSATDLPTGLSIDASTGQIAGTISVGAAANSPYTVTVTAADPAGNDSSGTFLWAVSVVPRAPTAVNDTVAVAEDGSVDADVLANDVAGTAPIDPASVQIAQAPATGAANVLGNGRIRYAPAANASGTATFTYTVAGTDGRRSAPATVTVNVSPVNDAPSFVAGPDPVVAEDAGAQRLTGWASAISAGPADEQGQTLSFSVVSNTRPGLFSAGPSVAPNGTLTFEAAPDSFGTAEVELVLVDDGGTANGGVDTSAPATVTFTVTPVNDPPVARNDRVGDVGQTATAVFSVLTNDSDPERTALRIVQASDPVHGTAEVVNGRRISYTAPATYLGPDSLSYVIVDADGARSQPAWVFIDVTATANPAVAVNDTVSVVEEGEVEVDVLANDQDPNGQPRLVTVGEPSNGIAREVSPGRVRYEPNPDFSGRDGFTYTIAGSRGGTSVGRVVVNVLPVNDPPVAMDDDIQATPGQPVEIDVLGNDRDPDGDLLRITIQSPDHGEASVVGEPDDPVIRYTPNAGYIGADRIRYTITDPSGASDRAWVNILVGAEAGLAASFSGLNVVPAVASLPGGTIEAVAEGRVVTLSGSVQGLRGRFEEAHLHLAPVGASGPVILDLNATPASDGRSVSFDGAANTFDMNVVAGAVGSQADDIVNALLNGRTYVDIHTDQFPDGEARGQLLGPGIDPPPAPELATLDVASGGPPVLGGSRSTIRLLVEGYAPGSRGYVLIFAGAALDSLLTVLPIDPPRAGASPAERAVLVPADDLERALDERGIPRGTPVSLYARGAATRGSAVSFGEALPQPVVAATHESGLSGFAVSVPVPTSGSGSLAAVKGAGGLRLDGFFANLLSPLAEAWVEVGAPGAGGTPAVRLSPERQGPNQWRVDEVVPLTPPLERALAEGRLYVQVYSEGFEEGELRGQLYPAPNAPPAPLQMIAPAPGGTLTLAGDLDAPVVIDWSGGEDAEQPVVYFWQLAETADFVDPLLTIEAGANTELRTDVGFLLRQLEASGLKAGESADLFHRAVATDGSFVTEADAAPITFAISTTVSREDGAVPERFALHGNYPNPFNPATTIVLDLPHAAAVTVEVYDVLGRRVLALPPRALSAGSGQRIEVDGGRLESGLYLYRVATRSADGEDVRTGRMMLVK